MEESRGDRIRRLRKAKGWNQEELAKKVGVERKAVSGWENDTQDIEAENLLALANALGVTAEYLQYGPERTYREAFERIAAAVDEARRKLPTESPSEIAGRGRDALDARGGGNGEDATEDDVA